MTLPNSVKIVEVSPRDGLQNEPVSLSSEVRIELVDRLTKAGLNAIEAGSFVSPKWVPQMADSEDVFRGIHRGDGVTYSGLVPNVQGLHRAMEVDATEVAVFTAASEAFCQANTNCSIEESLERIRQVVEVAQSNNIRVRGYVSCAVACPYEGLINPERVRSVSSALHEMGCYEVSLGDTIGVGTPLDVQRLIEACSKDVSPSTLAVHLHDTYGQALANIYAALQMGIRVVDSSVAGLGGCPYAGGATGNVATEDVVYLLDGLGIEHGVDLDVLIEAGRFITDQLGVRNASKVATARSETT